MVSVVNCMAASKSATLGKKNMAPSSRHSSSLKIGKQAVLDGRKRWTNASNVRLRRDLDGKNKVFNTQYVILTSYDYQ